MPFTFSHPAIVLPFYNKLIRRWFSITGLVIGSVAPDFEYFIRMDHKRVYTHTWDGLFLYDIPLGILLAFIFHNIVRNAFIDNTPERLQRKLAVFKRFNWNHSFKKRWGIIINSFIIGGVSHLLWDSFTHKERFFVREISFLRARVQLGDMNFHVYTLSQLLCSAIGMIIIIYALWQLPTNKNAKVNRNIAKYWVLVAGTSFVVFYARTIFDKLNHLHEALIPAISAFLIAIILTPILLNRTTKVQKGYL